MSGRTGTFLEDPETGRIVMPQKLIEAVGGSIFGNLKEVVRRKYIGDNTNDRIIDMGVICRIIFLVTRTSFAAAAAHPAWAYMIDDAYGTFWQDAGNFTIHQSMAIADSHLQGKMSAPDETKFKLGTFGATAKGWNNTGDLYTAIGFVFEEVED